MKAGILSRQYRIRPLEVFVWCCLKVKILNLLAVVSLVSFAENLVCCGND